MNKTLLLWNLISFYRNEFHRMKMEEFFSSACFLKEKNEYFENVNFHFFSQMKIVWRQKTWPQQQLFCHRTNVLIRCPEWIFVHSMIHSCLGDRETFSWHKWAPFQSGRIIISTVNWKKKNTEIHWVFFGRKLSKEERRSSDYLDMDILMMKRQYDKINLFERGRLSNSAEDLSELDRIPYPFEMFDGDPDDMEEGKKTLNLKSSFFSLNFHFRWIERRLFLRRIRCLWLRNCHSRTFKARQRTIWKRSNIWRFQTSAACFIRERGQSCGHRSTPIGTRSNRSVRSINNGSDRRRFVEQRKRTTWIWRSIERSSTQRKAESFGTIKSDTVSRATDRV